MTPEKVNANVARILSVSRFTLQHPALALVLADMRTVMETIMIESYTEGFKDAHEAAIQAIRGHD